MKILFVILSFFLASCSGDHHPEYIGDYYLYYKDGRVLSENDSVNQVYIHLHGDHTFKIKYLGGVESGRWKTIDYDDFSITYFYSTYWEYLFNLDAIGETFMGYASQDSKTKVFIASRWYGKSKMADYLHHQILICEQNRVITTQDLNNLLRKAYGSNLRIGNTADIQR